jgi:uncharacterized protein (TIGR03067 family)
MRARILGGLVLGLALAFAAFVRGDGGGDPTAYAFRNDDDRAELERGEWRIVELNGQDRLEGTPEQRLVFKDGKLSYKTSGAKGKDATNLPLRINPDARPRQIEWPGNTGRRLGIYQLDGDTLRIAFENNKRPTDFTPAPPYKIVYVLKRVRP